MTSPTGFMLPTARRIDPPQRYAYYPGEAALGGELAVPWNRNPLQRAEYLPEGFHCRVCRHSSVLTAGPRATKTS